MNMFLRVFVVVLTLVLCINLFACTEDDSNQLATTTTSVNTSETIATVPDESLIQYREDIINAVLDKEGTTWSGSDWGEGCIQFIDFNFDGKLEFVLRCFSNGGFSLSSTSPSEAFYYDGELTRANDWFGFNDELTGYYNTLNKEFILLQPKKSINGYDLNYTLYNNIIEFDGMNVNDDICYSSMEKKDDPKDNIYYDGANGYLDSAMSNVITKEQYDTINADVIKDCVNINMQYDKIELRDWFNYSANQKREALEKAYDSFTYDITP